MLCWLDKHLRVQKPFTPSLAKSSNYEVIKAAWRSDTGQGVRGSGVGGLAVTNWPQLHQEMQNYLPTSCWFFLKSFAFLDEVETGILFFSKSSPTS